jgi:hypothetical protein
LCTDLHRSYTHRILPENVMLTKPKKQESFKTISRNHIVFKKPYCVFNIVLLTVFGNETLVVTIYMERLKRPGLQLIRILNLKIFFVC